MTLRVTLGSTLDEVGRQTIVAAVVGELDLHSAAILRSVLNSAEDSRPDQIVVDLGGLAFIDSAGIGVLVGALRRAEARGAGLTAVNVSRTIQGVLDVTHLSHALGLVAPTEPRMADTRGL